MYIEGPHAAFPRLAKLIEKFKNATYRRAYYKSHTRHFLAKQMRGFRGGNSQTDYARKLGVAQSTVSERYENPSYGKWNLQTLFDIADKEDVAVFVRFVDFKTFLDLTSDMSDEATRPDAYNEESLDEATRSSPVKLQGWSGASNENFQLKDPRGLMPYEEPLPQQAQG